MNKAAAVRSLVLGLGFGLPGAYSAWYDARHREVWTFLGLPMYGDGPSERWGLPTSTVLLDGFALPFGLLLMISERLWSCWITRPLMLGGPDHQPSR